MKLLFISEVFPYPPTSGRRIPLWHTLRLLGKKHEIALASFRQPKEEITPAMVGHVEQYCRVVGVYTRVEVTPPKILVNLWERYPLSFYRYPGSALAKGISEFLAQNPVDVAHFFGVNVAQFWNLVPDVPRVLAPNDCPHLILERAARSSQTPLVQRLHSMFQLPKMRRYEAEVFPKFRVVHVVTRQDRESLLTVTPGVSVEVVPLGVEAFRSAVETPVPSDQHLPTLLFTGALGAKRDVVAILFFFKKVLPIVRRQVPNVRLYLVGNDPHPRLKALARKHPEIVVTGYVEDLLPYLRRADVYVCPLVVATGMQNRVLEAMAAGKAIVCTSNVAERLEVTPGEHLLVADFPQEFAAHVVRLIRDTQLREKLGKAAQAVAREKYTWEAAAGRVAALYRDVVGAGWEDKGG